MEVIRKAAAAQIEALERRWAEEVTSLREERDGARVELGELRAACMAQREGLAEQQRLLAIAQEVERVLVTAC